MERYEFIESGIIFNLDCYENLKKFRYNSGDFAKHQDAYTFVVKFIDEYRTFPAPELLLENFTTLDIDARSLDFEYLINRFTQQLLHRNILKAFRQNKNLLDTDPAKAYFKIQSDLHDISLINEDDIDIYNHATEQRLEKYLARKAISEKNDGLLGIPTPFPSINNSGVGWMPGELISLFARPAVGKSWMCLEVAATALLAGIRTLFISGEMTVDAVNMRLDVIVANKLGYKLEHKNLRKGKYVDEDMYAELLKRITNEQKNFFTCDHITGQNGITIESILSLVRKHKPEFIVIDGIYLIDLEAGSNKQQWDKAHEIFHVMKRLCLSEKVPMFVSTQANRDAKDVYTPPNASSVAFGDALIRASDMAFSMSKMQDENDVEDPLMRRIQLQKIRDHEQFIDDMYLTFDVNVGHIEEIVGYDRFTSY